ncbi:MAG: hypothetical protein Kow0062_01450 [Acidobacteriota bacterium]
MDALTRDVLEAGRVDDLVRGGWTKADLWRARTPDGRLVVVKDFAAKSALIRLWGRLQVSREVAALEALAGVDGVPRVLARPDAWALVLEYIDGTELRLLAGRPDLPRLLAGLRAVIDRTHARGVIHNDLRGRENVLVEHGSDRVVVIDWAGAVRLPPGTLRHRILFPLLRLVDEGAFLKWKRMMLPESLTERDRRFLARFEAVRRLWPFNRKRPARAEGRR